MSGIDSLAELMAALLRPNALAELALLALCLVLAWGVVRLARRAAPGSIAFGTHGVDGVLFPLLALLLALAARWLMQGPLHGVAAGLGLDMAVFKLAVPILSSLAMIRVAVRVLDVAFPASPLVRTFGRGLSWLVWIGLVLWLTRLLPLLLAELEGVQWHIAGSVVSLRSLVEGAFTAMVVLLAMLWLSATIEGRLMAAGQVSLSVRKIAANATRAALLLVGLLLALSAAGIPLAALSVLGGAVGIGLGFGLQKLAANYVSGFVILAERSLRIGDLVKVDGFEGRIADIKTRYTVLRSVTGRESIVPNELLITQRVENWSLADPKVALKSVVQVAYGTELAALTPQLVAALQAVPRVLADPAPSVQLSAFASDGLELTLVFWIADLENGQGNVLSDVNLAVLRTLGAAGVEIPYPQRVLRRAV